MATVAWNPNGQNTAQVMLFTGTAVANGGSWSLVAPTGKVISYVMSAADTIATAISAFADLLSSQDAPPEFGEVDFSVLSATITITANSPGTPFLFTKSQSGGATCTISTTTANSSQNDVINPANWIRNGVAQIPQNGDDAVIANSSVPLLWNLDQLASVLLNSWTRYQSFTGTIGLPEISILGYIEWRPTYLKLASNINPALGAFPLFLGPGSGNGPSRERYDMQSYRTNLSVIASGTPADAYAVRFLGSHGQNQVSTIGVSVGLAMLPTESVPNGTTVNTATVGAGGTLDCGPGCAFSGTGGGGTLTMTGGSSTLFCTPTIVARNNATLTLAAKDGTYASLSATSGVQVSLLAPMTISVLSLLKSSNLDNSKNLGVVTVTTSTIDGDTCRINDPNNGITFTNATSVNGQVSQGPFVVTGPRTMKVT